MQKRPRNIGTKKRKNTSQNKKDISSSNKPDLKKKQKEKKISVKNFMKPTYRGKTKQPKKNQNQ